MGWFVSGITLYLNNGGRTDGGTDGGSGVGGKGRTLIILLMIISDKAIAILSN